MKRYKRYICFLLVISMLIGIPVAAQSEIEPRESAFFLSHDAFISKVTENRFKVWFDVTAAGTMQKLGACEIEIDRSTDGSNWELIASYDSAFYPAMIASNTCSHTSYITYHAAVPGYYYRAYVTFYAKNSTGTGKLFRYSAAFQM